jgi:hypothetical protein
VISGCYNNSTGALRVINAPSKSCTTKQTPISWNALGEPSYGTTVTVAQSIVGQGGPEGCSTTGTFTGPCTATATLTLPTGTYLLGGTGNQAVCTLTVTGSGDITTWYETPVPSATATAGPPGTLFGYVTIINASDRVQWNCTNYYYGGPSVVVADATQVSTQ